MPTSNVAEQCEAALRSATPNARVWVDIGTSYRSLATWDVEHNASLILVGIEALHSNLWDPRQLKQRFVRLEAACSSSPEKVTTFFVHASSTCGSLLSANRRAPSLGSGRDACTGDVPKKHEVTQAHLSELLQSTRVLGRRIELLKIDVQGSELSCLRSGKGQLHHVDNILLEVQDVLPSSDLLMYDGAATLQELDPQLAQHGFTRQYCEWNRWAKHVREMNCLYMNKRKGDTAWMWATGNAQRGRSMVSYDRELPPFLGGHVLARSLWSSNFTGERVMATQRMRPIRPAHQPAQHGHHQQVRSLHDVEHD
jgi:FkbM family methyltransferase